MTCERLQEVECLGNWMRNGHIVGTRLGGLGLACDPDIGTDDLYIEMSDVE